MLSTPTPAHAGAIGCAYIGGFGFDFKGVHLQAPKGFLCHRIEGRDRTITNERVAYQANIGAPYGLLTGRVCNWRIDLIYRSDADGAPVYLRDRGPTNNWCGYSVTRNVSADKRLAHYGQACAELRVTGLLRKSQCHKITKPWRPWRPW